MSDDEVYDAIEAFLSDPANIAVLADPASGNVPPIRFENPQSFEKPEPPAPWIAMSLTGVVYDQQSIGAESQADNLWDERGSLWLPVFVETGTGSSRARKIAKQIANLFRGLTLMDGDLEFMAAYIGQGGKAPSEEGDWFQLSVIIDWRRTNA